VTRTLVREWRRCWLGEHHHWIGSRAGEILLDTRLKVARRRRVDIELPLVGTHLSLHLVDLSEREHALTHDTPRLVRISIVTDNLGCKHKGGNK